MTTVLIVEDQELVREGFRSLIDAAPDLAVVGVAPDGDQGVELARRLSPDVVMMDIRMPGLDGIEATRRIRGEASLRETRVLILTTYGLDEYIFDALRAGASGFLLKDTPIDELRDAIRALAAGDSLLSPSVTRALIEEFLRTRRAPLPHVATTLGGLTDREREVTILVAEGLSNQEIAERLVLSSATVKTHVSRILSKLQLRDRVQLVIAAYELDLVGRGAQN